MRCSRHAAPAAQVTPGRAGGRHLLVALRLALVGLCLAVPTTAIFGQAALPSISSISPQAAHPGQTVDVKIRGGNLANPTQLWSTLGTAVPLTPDVAGNGTNAAEVTYRVQLPADAPLGVQALRIATAQGISNLKLFVVDDLPSVAQARPNQTPAQAQVLTLPVAVDGFVENLTRDYYRFTVAAGQRVSFEVLARRLGSPLDPMIRLLDSRGRELTYSDDAPGLSSDAMLSHTFAEGGEYTLEVRDIRFQGNAGFQYRLRIGDFPCVTVPYPMGVRKGESAQLAFAGPAAQGAAPLPLHVPADFGADWLNVAAKGAGGKGSGFAVVSVGTGAELLEVEPNNEAAQANRIVFPTGINGRFEQPGDVDRFAFAAKAGQRFLFAGVTRSQGSPSDLYLRVPKPDGTEVATDDNGPGEGTLDFTAPADGDYVLIVEDLNRRGGPEFVYRIVATVFEEKFSLSASADSVNVPVGGQAMISVTAARGKFTGPISLSLRDAPEGVTAAPATIGAGQTAAVMTITCAPTTAAGKVHALKIVGVSQLGETRCETIAGVTDAQKGALNGLLTPPQSLGQTVAMGVSPAPLFALRTDRPEVVFGKDLSATVKVLSTRAAGFAEPITLAVQVPAGAAAGATGLPAGVTASVKPIPKDQNEVEIVFAANAQAPLGPFSVVVSGTGKQGNATVVQPVPSLAAELRSPFVLKTDLAGGKLALGQTLKIKVTAERNPAYRGPIALSLQGLPKGVTASAATIAADQAETEVTLTAAADAAVGAAPNIVVRGEGTNGNAKLTADSGKGTVEVGG